MISFPSVFESIDDLTKPQIEGLISLSNEFIRATEENRADGIYFTNKRPIVATSFLENSTRTKHSFAIAIQRLGAMYIDFNVETSSLKKGESLEETFLTLYNQGVSLCVVRTSISNQFKEFKNAPPIKIINGGDGVNEHPTQALLDLLTLINLAGGIENLNGKTISIVGDNIHSRVGHSLIKLLPQFGMKVILSGPKEYLPTNLNNPNVKLLTDRDETILNSDYLYLLRIQKERHENISSLSFDHYLDNFGVQLNLLKKMNKLIPVLHPGPCNIGVELDQDLIKSSLYKGHRQVYYSVPMRMAIVSAILNNNDKNIGIVHGEKF
jgi:aspartate carbamoyltransferase catalytic subunit